MVAHHARGLAGVDQVVDDQQALAAAAAELCVSADNALQHLEIALLRRDS